MKFQEVLKISLAEPEVRKEYSKIIEEYFPNATFLSLYKNINHDGIFEDKKLGLKLLAEFKYDKKIEKRKHFIDCIIQIIYYIKKIEFIGEQYPNVIFIGNKTRCTCFHSDLVLKYLDYNADWKIDPSAAASKNPYLHKDLTNDININPYFYNIFEINFKEVIDQIVSLNYRVEKKIMINEFNVSRLFTEFINKVIVRPFEYDANALVSIFINIINDPDNNYLHPTKPNMLKTKHLGNIRVNAINYKAFFSHIQSFYTPDDKDKLTAISDRLIEDITRRIKGEFYTDTNWVNKAHNMIEELFGVNWKNEYVIWDPAWGYWKLD